MVRPSTQQHEAPSHEEVLAAVLTASRVLIGIAARSLAATGEDVTLPQYRALVVLSYNGPQRTIDLAEELGVTSSTATRMVDRLVRRRLVRRTAHPDDRRAICVEITDDGGAVVAAVQQRRRREFSAILRRMDADARRSLLSGLEAMRDAAGESDESAWTLGWA